MLEGTYEEPETEPETDIIYANAAIDELGPVGTYGDEDLYWLREKPKKVVKKVSNRTSMRRTQPIRGYRDDSPPTVIKEVRL